MTTESEERAVLSREVERADRLRLAQLRARLIEQRALMRQQRSTPILHPSAATARHDGGSSSVPWGMDVAAAWAWRFLVVVAAGLVILQAAAIFAVVTLPLVIALLIAALASPGVRLMRRLGLPPSVGAAITVLGGLAFVAILLTFAGQQIANGATDLADSVVRGLDEVRDWLQDGPLNASESQINDSIAQAQTAITDRTQDGQVLAQVTEVGTALGHVLAGFFIVLFSTYFFLADGERIWSWLVRLAPRSARVQIDSSGRVAWVSLTQFVRATVIVALVDAIGIAIVAAVLGVPFVLAIAVLVFLGAFVPMIGATIAGTVAILVALVDQGPITALFMLGGVILVQQIEGHILQPFLMGRWVSLHPLGVIVAIAGGVIVAGIAGALVAVPLAAVANAVVQHLAQDTDVGEHSSESAVGDDQQATDEDSDTPDKVSSEMSSEVPAEERFQEDPG